MAFKKSKRKLYIPFRSNLFQFLHGKNRETDAIRIVKDLNSGMLELRLEFLSAKTSYTRYANKIIKFLSEDVRSVSIKREFFSSITARFRE